MKLDGTMPSLMQVVVKTNFKVMDVFVSNAGFSSPLNIRWKAAVVDTLTSNYFDNTQPS